MHRAKRERKSVEDSRAIEEHERAQTALVGVKYPFAFSNYMSL